MNFNEIKFDWLTRFGKVFIILLFLITIPIAYTISTEIAWGEPISNTFLYTALYLLVGYLILVLFTKIVLYITKGDNFLASGFKKKQFFLLSIPIILALIVGFIFGVIIEPAQRNKERTEIKIAYQEAISKVDGLKEELKTCFAPIVEKKYSEEVRSCNLLKNKVKHDYNFCVSLESINSPASCLYENDYEKIDCSENTLRDKAESQIRESDLTFSCKVKLSELQNANKAIDAYNSMGN